MAKELTRKEKQITQLYIETLEEVSRNADNWISFLKRASYNYKYKFDEQILIYAQKPDAVACAETTIWNKKLKRWVNKGSKGIALITEKDGELGLRFVFDVSDTNSNVYGRKLKLWQAEEKYTDSIIEALEDRFGTMEDKSNLPLAIISTVYNHIVDNMQDYLEELKSVTANSKLETLKPEELENSFLEIIIYSTIALTMSRCGLDVNDYIRKDCFNEIEKFNTFETMCILGTATRDFSKEILLEISKTVINLEKQEKNKNYTFERLRKNIYNKENEKGSVENENNLQSERELSNTRLDNRENKQESETKNHEKPNETIVINQEPNVNDNANVNDNENVNATYHKLIYDTWIKNNLPLSKLSKNNYLNFQQTELKQCLNEINRYSLNPQEVVHAIENAGSVKKLMDSGQSWRQFSISFKSFWNNIATYFDGAFDLNAFKKPNNSVSAELNTVDFDALKSQADVDRELTRIYHQRK